MFYNKTQRESGRSKSFNQQKPHYNFRTWILLILLFCLQISTGQEQDVLQELMEAIDKAPAYDAQKLEKIGKLRLELESIEQSDLERLYNLNHELMQEYRVFKQDSAFFYALRTRELARELEDKEMIANANMNLADINITAGMYKEALGFLEEVRPEELSRSNRRNYYGLSGRCYNDMADYSNLSLFSVQYRELAKEYYQQTIALSEPGTFVHASLQGYTRYLNGELEEALGYLLPLLKMDLGLREEAMVNSSVGDIYSLMGENDKALYHLTRAAIADIRSSVKENLAMIRLADLLFKEGEVRKASVFIKKANKDADFYGAQQRKIRVGAILPLIEEQVIRQIENQRARLYRQNIMVSLLLLFVVVLAVIIYSQVHRLKRARKIIGKAHEELQEKNRQITAVNEQISSKNRELNRLNGKLMETNRIKEEYIGFFFTRDAEIFEKFKDFKRRIEKYVENNNLKKINYLLKNYDLKKEKEKLLRNFDEAFIKLFPNFIEEFNSLLRPEEKIKIKKDQLLNKELRIFALMRLGIKHNEVIAQILGYSVPSIYTFKSRTRRKSPYSTKDFDKLLLENTTLEL